MADDLDALLAALDGEIAARKSENPYRDLTDEERVAAIKRLAAAVAERGDASGAIGPLTSEDKDRAAALGALLTRLGMRAAPERQPDLSPAPLEGEIVEPSLAWRAGLRGPSNPQRVSLLPAAPSTVIEARAEPSERAPQPIARDPRRIELEQIWRMDHKRPRVPSRIAWTLDSEFGLGEEAGWRRILDNFLPGETAVEFARRVAEGHAAGEAARRLFRRRKPGVWAWASQRD